jgi:hypothetical protein
LKTKNTYPLFILLLVSFCSCAQTKQVKNVPTTESKLQSDSNFAYSHFIAGNFTLMDIDVLDNMYLINSKNQLKKLNAKGDSVAVFNDVKKYGNPSLIDVSNPLKTLLYYKSFSTVVVLDRFLTVRNNINFRNKNIFKAKAIATSYDNNIWLFDEQDFKLKKINDEGKLLSETTDWRQIFEEVPSPSEIIDRDGSIYLHDVKKGFYVFDYYGSLKLNIPFENWKHIAIANKTITGFVDAIFHRYELQSLQLKTYNLPQFINHFKDIKVVNGKLYVHKIDGIEVYKIL